MTAEEWLRKTYYQMKEETKHLIGNYPIIPTVIPYFNTVRPWAQCKDGTIVSIQGSRSHYSVPKEFVDSYKFVEIGLMNPDPSLDEEYFMENTGFTEKYEVRRIYGYVSMKNAEDLVSSHGGIEGCFVPLE